MANLRHSFSVLVSAAVCFAANVQAADSVASLVQINGTALVDQGEQYTTAKEGMALRTGDRVMVMEGGSAILKFADGCSHPVGDNRIVTVGAADSCTSGALAQDSVGPYYAAAATPPAIAGAIAAGVLGTVVILGASDVIERGSDERGAVPPLRPLSP